MEPCLPDKAMKSSQEHHRRNSDYRQERAQWDPLVPAYGLPPPPPSPPPYPPPSGYYDHQYPPPFPPTYAPPPYPSYFPPTPAPPTPTSNERAWMKKQQWYRRDKTDDENWVWWQKRQARDASRLLPKIRGKDRFRRRRLATEGREARKTKAKAKASAARAKRIEELKEELERLEREAEEDKLKEEEEEKMKEEEEE
ncbi:MAG: hypothetical protein Q9177_001139 [Variospora cf. flavescens]